MDLECYQLNGGILHISINHLKINILILMLNDVINIILNKVI
jgi:hypothetical protein